MAFLPFEVRALISAFAAVLFLVSPASAQPSPRAGTIIYDRAPDGGEPWPVIDIYSMAADGSNVQALTRDGHSHDPAWLPDGRRILFLHDSTLQTQPAYREQKGFESHHAVELYVMDADGRNPRLLRRVEPVIFSAACSPDGKTIAITCMPRARVNRAPAGGDPMRAGLFLLAADGQGELRLLFRNALSAILVTRWPKASFHRGESTRPVGRAYRECRRLRRRSDYRVEPHRRLTGMGARR